MLRVRVRPGNVEGTSNELGPIGFTLNTVTTLGDVVGGIAKELDEVRRLRPYNFSHTLSANANMVPELAGDGGTAIADVGLTGTEGGADLVVYLHVAQKTLGACMVAVGT